MNDKSNLPDEKNCSSRQPYQKPVMNKVNLMAGEAVLSTCKNGFGGQSACQYVSLNCNPSLTQTS